MKDDASDDERNFGVDWFSCIPMCECADVVFRDGDAIAITQNRFEDQSDGNREAGNFSEACLFECREGIDGARLASGGERSESFEWVVVGHDKLKQIAKSKEGGRGKPDRLQNRRLFKLSFDGFFNLSEVWHGLGIALHFGVDHDAILVGYENGAFSYV